MKQLLINTPLKISWKANFGSLQKSDLSLSLENPIVVIPIADFEIDDDKVVFSFGVEDQKYGGKYDAVLRNSSGDIIDVAAAIDLIPNEHNNTLGQNDVITVEPDYGGGSPGPGPTPTTGLRVIVSTADWALISSLEGVTANTKSEAAQIAGISEEDLDFLLNGGDLTPCLFVFGANDGANDYWYYTQGVNRGHTDESGSIFSMNNGEAPSVYIENGVYTIVGLGG